MLSRSRAIALHVLTLALIAVVVVGCSTSKAKPERRAPIMADSDMMTKNTELVDAGTMGESGAPTFGPSDGWAPGEAPPPDDFGADGTMRSIGDDAAFDPSALDAETGDLKNTASTEGVEDGGFVSELEMIHFEFDSSEIAEDWKSVLNEHATWINSNGSVMVQVEGHCDERGTEEYNLALGQRRADSVRNYLVSQGVDPDRLSTISYGKMRPLTFDQNEEAHSLNRRAMFLVYEVEDPAVASAY